MAHPSSSSSSPSRNLFQGPRPSWVPVEPTLEFIDFKIEFLSPDRVEGRFVVSEKSCQPFGVLNGGVSALIAEILASTGSSTATGFQRVAAIELNINHLRAAPIGTEVVASAKSVHHGKNIHVWDVTFLKVESTAKSDSPKHTDGTLIALARVTLVVGLIGKLTEDEGHAKPHSRL